MTKQRTYHARCPYCGDYPAKCAGCGENTTGSTPFSDWMREECPMDSRYADLQNLDYIWFVYRQGWFITLEEKMFGKSGSMAQKDTHNIVTQLLVVGSEAKEKIKTLRGDRLIEYRGHYLVIFEQTTPDDSEWIRVNGQVVTKDGLLLLLRNGRLPEKEARGR